MLGLVLLIGLPIVAITGLLSNIAYQPHLGDNLVGTQVDRLNFDPFAWPTRPSWLYAFTQGVHVSIGLALVPVLLAKLWSVIPRLFEWPPVRSPAHALERLSLIVLVGSALFEFVTGIIDIQLVGALRLLLPGRPLLRRVGVHRGVRPARCAQAADDATQACASAES